MSDAYSFDGTNAPPLAAAQAPAAPPQPATLSDKFRKMGAIFSNLNGKSLSDYPDLPTAARAALAAGRQATDIGYSALPTAGGISSDMHDLHSAALDATDAALSLSPAQMAAYAASVGRGTQQAATGFNEGIAPVLNAPNDALDYVIQRGKELINGAPAQPIAHPVHDNYNAAYVDPAGAPATPMQSRLRAGGNAVAQNLPVILGGMGLAASGTRAGMTLADQAAGGLVDAINAPPAAAASGIAGKLRSMLPSFWTNATNGLNPSNVVNAVRPANLQGAADTALDWVARNPAMTTKLGVLRAFRQGEHGERVRQDQPAQPPQDWRVVQ